jgi:uncharacterized protein YozE (UPF0346 family)
MKMSFYEFLATYPHNDDAIGDLASSVRNDPKVPKANACLIDYLNQNNADAETLDAAIAAWKESRR